MKTTWRSARRVITQFGSEFRSCTEIVEECFDSVPAGRVLVRNHFAGVNGFYDKQMCLNNVAQAKLALPHGTGVEAVGVIEAVGPGVDASRVGESVSTVRVGQGYCQYQVIEDGQAIEIPAATGEILTLIPTGISALVALEQVAEMGRGEVIAVSAAAGGLGHIVSQLALNAGNHVVGICGSAEKAAALQSLGLHRVINYREEPLDQVLNAEYKDRLNIAFDSVGGAVYDAFIDNLAPHGRHIISGYAAEVPRPQPVMQPRVSAKLYWKAASVRGFMNYRFSEYAADARVRLLEMQAAGKLKIFCEPDRFAGLESVPDAVEHMLSGQNLGKVMVSLQGRDDDSGA